MKEEGYKEQGCGKGRQPHPAPPTSGLSGNRIGQQVKHHGRPAGVAAPAAPEEERAGDFRHSVMDGGRLKNAQKEIVPEALDLHIFSTDQSQIDQHVAAHQQLGHQTGVPESADIQGDGQRQTAPNVGKVEQVKGVVQPQPEPNGDPLKEQKEKQGSAVFLQELHRRPPSA